MSKISDDLRAEAVALYQRGTMTQAQVCAAFEAKTGCRLSPRTLRAWDSRARTGGGLSGDARSRLLRALRHVEELRSEIAALIEDIDRQDLSAQTSSAQLPVPHGPEPAAASAALTKPGITPAAATLPTGKEEHPPTNRGAKAESFWD